MSYTIERESKINDVMDELQLIHDTLGLTSKDAYNEYLDKVIHGLVMFGSDFLIKLAFAIEAAPIRDQIRMLFSFRNEASKAAMMFEIFRAKQEAEEREKNGLKAN